MAASQAMDTPPPPKKKESGASVLQTGRDGSHRLAGTAAFVSGLAVELFPASLLRGVTALLRDEFMRCNGVHTRRSSRRPMEMHAVLEGVTPRTNNSASPCGRN